MVPELLAGIRSQNPVITSKAIGFSPKAASPAQGFPLGENRPTLIPQALLNAQAELPYQLEQIAKQFDASFFNDNNFLAEDHPCKQELDQVLHGLLNLVGLEPGSVTVHVFDQRGFIGEVGLSIDKSNRLEYKEFPTAMINPVTGNMFISRALLDALDYDMGEVRAVMAHELAHFLFKHHCELDQSNNFDPIGDHIGNFAEEYSCDRLASFLSSLSGDKPTAIADALSKIEQQCQRIMDRLYGKDSGDENLELYQISLLSSHPHSKRRIRSCQQLARQMQQTNSQARTLTQIQEDDISSQWTGANNSTTRSSALAGSRTCLRIGITVNDPLRAAKLTCLSEALNDSESLRETVLEFFPQYCKIQNEQNLFGVVVSKLHLNTQALNALSDKEFKQFIQALEEQADLKLTDTDHLEDGVLEKSLGEQITDLEEAQASDSQIEELINNWFQAAVLSCNDAGYMEALDCFQEDFKNLSLDQIKLVFSKINTRYLIDTDQAVGLVADSMAYQALSHLLASTWLEAAQAAGQSELAILQEMVELANSNLLRYGSSVLHHSPSFVKLLSSCFETGSTETKKSIIGLMNQNFLVTNDLMPIYFFANLGDNNIYKTMEEFAKENNLDHRNFGRDRVKLASKLETEIAARSRLKEITLTRVPEIKVILEKSTGVETSLEQRSNPNSVIPSFHICYSDELSPEFLAEAKDKITALALEAMKTSASHNPGDLATEFPAYMAKEFNEAWDQKFIDKAYKNLQAQKLQTQDELRQFMYELQDDTSLTGQLAKLRGSSLEAILNLGLSASAEDYIILHGSDQFREEFYRLGRDNIEMTGYTQAETMVFSFSQLWNIWHEGFAEEYSELEAGIEKLKFLVTSQPIACLSRDQRMIEALGLSPITILDDTKTSQEEIKTLTDIETLFTLRDSFYNKILTQTCEARIYEFYLQQEPDPNRITTTKTILKNITDPDLRNDKELERILVSYSSPSYHKNELLRPFIDKANSKNDKDLLSSFLTEPSVVDRNMTHSPQATTIEESLLDLVANTRDLDKADFLLYLLGQRDFVSDDPEAKLNHGELDTETGELQYPDGTIFVAGSYRGGEQLHYQQPDVVIKISKALGIKAETLLSMEQATSSKRQRMEVLEIALNGQRGISQNPELKNQFLDKVANRLVETNQSLAPEQKQAMREFLAFALKNCPEEKISNIFFNLWNISSQESVDMPTLLAQFMQSSGPAFIKFGQKLATMNIPAEYKSAFRTLSSENTVSDTNLFYHHLDAEYRETGSPFDPSASGQKLGEGSMATTYRAKLNPSQASLHSQGLEDQRAIKIIHPFIRPEINMDIDYIGKLIDYINQHSADFNGLKIPSNTAEILRAQLMAQSDPSEEIYKAELLANELLVQVKDGLQHIPITIDKDLSRGNLLVSKLKPGYELDSPLLEDQLGSQEANALRNKVGLRVLRQILVGSCYQSDVNLGNFGVVHDEAGQILKQKSKPIVVWYDSGAVETISANEQKTLVNLIMAFNKVAGKDKELATILSSMVKLEADEIDSFQTKVTDWLDASSIETEGLDQIKEQFEGFVDFVAQEGKEVSENWITIANTIAMLAPLMTPPKDSSEEDKQAHSRAMTEVIKSLVKESVSKNFTTIERLKLTF